jgi:hypothetical protein
MTVKIQTPAYAFISRLTAIRREGTFMAVNGLVRRNWIGCVYLYDNPAGADAKLVALIFGAFSSVCLKK